MIVAGLIPGVSTQLSSVIEHNRTKNICDGSSINFVFRIQSHQSNYIIECSKPTLKIDKDFEKSFWRAKNQESSKNITREISKEPKKNQVKRTKH